MSDHKNGNGKQAKNNKNSGSDERLFENVFGKTHEYIKKLKRLDQFHDLLLLWFVEGEELKGEELQTEIHTFYSDFWRREIPWEEEEEWYVLMICFYHYTLDVMDAIDRIHAEEFQKQYHETPATSRP